jgi:hypothetical protein
VSDSRNIRRSKLPAHRHTGKTEREDTRELGERRIGTRAAARGVSDQADAMPAQHLPARKIDHMAEQSPHGCAQDMQDRQAA